MINALRNSAVGYRRRGGFIAAYQSVYDSWTNKPSAAVAVTQNNMVKGWINDGLWAKRDKIHVFAVHTNDDGEALTNWKNPGTNDAIIVNAPVFVAFEGFTGDGATSYIDSNWTPSSDGVNYIQNSASLMDYIRNDLAESTFDIAAFDGALFTQVTASNITAKSVMALNGSSETSGPNVAGNGIHHYNRSGAASLQMYKDGVSAWSSTNASTGVVTLSFYVGARHNVGAPSNFTNRQYSLAAFGGSLTGPEMLADKNIIETYMDSNGKGVIS